MKRLLLSLALCGALPVSSVLAQVRPTTAANGVAAEVNGDKIQLDDLNRLVNSFKTNDSRLAANTPEAQKALGDIKTQVLDELITTRLLSQEARRQKIVPQPKEVEDAFAKLKSNFKSDGDFQTWLTADGQTPQDVRRVISDELAIRELSKRLTADITVSPDDIGAYYRANLDQFTVPEAIHVHHILLAVNPGASKADKDAVNKRALGLIAQLKKNAKFEDVARANSDDPGSKAQGGDLGTFLRGEMIQAFEDAAFGARVGEIVGPVVTEFGVHILRVDQRIPSRRIELAEVQKDPQLSAQIKAGLLKQKVQARLDQQIAKLRASAQIKKYA